MTTHHEHPEHGAPDSGRVLLPRAVSTALIGTFLILLAGAIYYARDFFLPLVLAVLFTLTFRPAARHLHRYGVPPPVSAVVLVVLLAGAAVGMTLLLAQPVTQMVSDAPRIVTELRARFSGLQAPLAELAAAGKQLQGLAADPSTESSGPQQVVIAQPGILSWAADTLSGIGTTLAATFIFAIFLLSSGDLFLHKLVRVVGSLSEAKRSLRIVHDVENEVSRYLLTISVINLGLGCSVGIAMAILGMPSPVAWAAAATLLNFIPYLGATLGIVTTALVSLITFPSLPMAVLPPAAYLVLSLLEGSLVTPLTLGRRLELNSVAILVALAFGGWMWGIVGALIAVPVLVVIKVFCDHFPNLSTFGEFLSSQTPHPASSEEAAVMANGDSPAPVDPNRKAA
jgi:predicted PurR-regulated permease PerM